MIKSKDYYFICSWYVFQPLKSTHYLLKLTNFWQSNVWTRALHHIIDRVGLKQRSKLQHLTNNFIRGDPNETFIPGQHVANIDLAQYLVSNQGRI